MKDKDLKSRLKSLRLRRPSSSYVDKVLAQKPETVEAVATRHWYGRRIWIYAPIAAAVLLFSVIGLMHWLPRGPEHMEVVQVPPELAELAQMPVEKLLEIHFGKIETSFDSSVVAATVKVALDKLSAREILDIGNKYSRQPRISARRAAYHPTAVSQVVEASEFVVRGRVEQVILDVSDIKAAILEKELDNHWFEHHGAMVKAEVQLEVFEAYPSLPALDSEKLRLWPVLHTRRLDVFENGKEYLIALQQDGDIIWMLPFIWGRYAEGVYPVDANTGMVSGLRNGTMPLDDAWLFIMDLYDAVHKGVEPAGEVLEYWLAKLQSEDLTDCWTAVEYFNTLQPPPVEPQLVIDAVVHYYDALDKNSRLMMAQAEGEIPLVEKNWKALQRDVWRQSTFFDEATDLLSRVTDELPAGQIQALFEEDLADSKGVLSEQAARELRSKVVRLLHKEHKEVHKPKAITKQEVMSRKEKIQSMIDRYRKGEKSIGAVISVMRKHLRAEDKEFVPFLLCEIVTARWDVPVLIAERIPDPCFVPVLRQALEKEVTGTLLAALFACGEEEEAIEMAVTELDKLLDEENGQMFGEHLYKLLPVIRFLGTTEDESVLPVIENFTREDVIDTLRETDARFGGQYAFIVNKLQQDAVLALARIGGESAIPRLKELYESDDIHIRILAALSLYYLGDDTGYELLSYFVNNTHRSVPEIEARWHVDLAGGYAFQAPIATYLRSPRTDALLLEKLRHGLDSGDTYAFGISSFVEDYKGQILAILVHQLSSRDRTTRKYANEILKRLTGQDFRFEPDRFVGQQDEVIEQWRSYVDNYLNEQ